MLPFYPCAFLHPLPIYILTRVYLQGSSTMFSLSHYEEWVIGIRGSRFWASEMKISISYGWFMHVWISEVGRDFIWVQIVKNSFTSTDLLFLSSTLTLFKVRDGELKKGRGAAERRENTSPFLWYQKHFQAKKKVCFYCRKEEKTNIKCKLWKSCQNHEEKCVSFFFSVLREEVAWFMCCHLRGTFCH